MSVALGHNPEVLTGLVEDAMLRGLEHSRCKVMLSLPDGAYHEVLLPEGANGFGVDATRCHMNLEVIAPELRSLLRPKGVGDDAIERVNGYVSQARNGTPLHFDARSVWIVQLVGTKLWLVSKAPAVATPHRNCIAPSHSTWVDYDGTRLAVPDDFAVTVLRPGDWLFVPKATWHATFSNTGSISATLAAPAAFDQ